ncbi:hypothetical protein AJ79_09565 [Helicocarpus griseus UAMH5409]|uniref:NADPH-dependent 1-acyldihydroxyacetone phosphate reductase n=1 Tax=Helicocarpus griseus UAMH5409 TaxID=1447875 RepID=A0A2B7WID8_9EURO|nr:hypothetical protein AJ79_09565 [Helicocarpus griseus UAMH5409]
MGIKSKRSVLVTGCSPGGIGHALALEFQRRGFRVLGTVRNSVASKDLESHGIEALELEVTSADSIAACKAEVHKRLDGRLDCLINNAGRAYTMPALDVDFVEVRHTFETNILGPMCITQAFAPLVIATQGRIVNVGSVAGVMPYIFGSAYNATKAALHAYTNTIRQELAPFGVKVILLVAGGVQTQIASHVFDVPENSIYRPIESDYTQKRKANIQNAVQREDFAKRVVSQILDEHAKLWIWEGRHSWTVWLIDTFFPRWIWDLIFNQMFGIGRLSKETWTANRCMQ